MKRRTTVLLAGAAMAGLMAGAATRTLAVPTTSDNAKVKVLASFGLLDDDGDKGKHDCKGKNACKGQGGCKTDTHGCKGQNACKGQGGCSTKG